VIDAAIEAADDLVSVGDQWTFVLHDKSAAKGEHEAEQDRAVEAMRAGHFDVIVCTESDRLDRMGPRAAYAFLWRLELASGNQDVVRVVGEPSFGRDDVGSEVLATVRMAQARDEVKLKRRRLTEKFREMDAAGSFRGMPPAGYMSTGPKWRKRLEPDVTGARGHTAEEIARAFTDAGNGTSTVKLGARLGMTPDGVAKLLRSDVYSTGRYPIKRADGVTVYVRTTPLVTPDVQRNAVAGIKARTTGDNVTSRRLRAAEQLISGDHDFSGAIYCGACDTHGRMYRYFGGGRPLADGTPSPRVRRYKCESCNKSVDAAKCDAEVDGVMSVRGGPWIVPVWIDGDDWSADLGRVKMELSELSARGLPDDEEDRIKAELRAERDRLTELSANSTAGHWEGRMSGKTEGDRWAELDQGDRRAWLTNGEFELYARSTGERVGGQLTGAVSVMFEYIPDADGN
jgi:DNA invertase Pin-like site-specific DNA recombinase